MAAPTTGTIQDNLNNAIQQGIPTSVILGNLTDSNQLKKEILYTELDITPVTILDTDPFSLNYLRITYIPDEFNLGKNLIRIRPDITQFVEGTQLYIEIIDYNGSPIYFETELNSETDDNFIIISVYIYDDTSPGPCAVYIGGTLKNVPIPNTERNAIFPINYKWRQIINVDVTEKTKSPIIFTTLPSIQASAGSASYATLQYAGGSSVATHTYYNLYVRNGYIDPVLSIQGAAPIFSSSMAGGKLYVNYNDINLIKPPRFTSNLLYGTGITASIDNFITSKSLSLTEPIVIYQVNKTDQVIINEASFRTASIVFEQDPIGTIASGFERRTLSVTFTDLDPFAGQIRNIKCMYRDTALENTEYLLLSDFLIPSDNVFEGYNPISASFTFLIPDSEIDERFDFRFEFFNNEHAPSKQVLEVKDILVPGVAESIVNNDGVLMVDPNTSTLDGRNLVRTLYQDYDVHTLYTSQSVTLDNSYPSHVNYPAITAINGKPAWPFNPPFSQSLADFTAFIPGGSDYVTMYYNVNLINAREITGDYRGEYSYNVKLSAVVMSTASYSAFDYPNDVTQSIVSSSISSITLSSAYSTGHMCIGYPIRHVMRLPETNKLIRFKLDHYIFTGDNLVAPPDSVSYVVSASIKDINILSSGYLFYSASQGTYISGALNYSIPSP